MSGYDLYRIYESEIDELKSKLLTLDHNKLLLDALQISEDQNNVKQTAYITTESNNKYLAVMNYYTSDSSECGWLLNCWVLGVMPTSKGDSVLVFYTDVQKTAKYTHHFFDRYAERLLESGDYHTRKELRSISSFEMLVCMYLMRNQKIYWIQTNSVFRNKVHIFSPISDGVALFQWNKEQNLLQANTFITENMLDSKQYEMVRNARIYIALPPEEKQKCRTPDFCVID